MTISPLFCVTSALDELQEDSPGCADALLDGDDIDTEDPELLEILGKVDEPSLIWTWFQTVGSSLLVHCMNAQRYMNRLLERMKFWWAVRHTKSDTKA